MGIMSLVKLFAKFVNGADLVAYLISALVAYLVSSLLPAGPWVSYTFVLLLYHLFLAWLVIKAERPKGVYPSILTAAVTHVCFLAVIVTFTWGVMNTTIMILILLRFASACLAVVERNLIFSQLSHKAPVVSAKDEALAKEAAAATATATAEEYDEWLAYLSKRDPRKVKAGTTVKDEYEQWMIARVKMRAAAPSSTAPANTTPA